MAIKQHYHHYIYCRSCGWLNEPNRIKMTQEAFEMRLKRQIVGSSYMSPDKYRKITDEEINRKFNNKRIEGCYQQDFMRITGLKCYRCNSNDVKIQVIEEIPIIRRN